MTKRYEFNWHIPVPEMLLVGCVIDRWIEERDAASVEQDCLFKVDQQGFFIYWKSEGNYGDLLELCQVSDVRFGGVPKDTKLLNQLMGKHGDKLEEKSLTICSGMDFININCQHIVFPDAEVAQQWKHGLLKITHNNKMNNVCVQTNLKKHWMRLGFLVNPQGKIPLRVIAKTFASAKNERTVHHYLFEMGFFNEKIDVIEPEEFTFKKFYELYHKICPRNDIEKLFQTITEGKGDAISMKQFITFLNEKQRDPRLNEILYPLYDKKRATEIINTYEENKEACKKGMLTKDGFTRYLMSDENAPVFLDRLDVYMDMNQPLSHYYINSSHNTYLTGRQFRGRSSVEMYRQVLLSGCRCLELDCWDGSREDEEPIITHGMAMCTDILFKDVIIAIRDTAFVTSDYPVILSFENHCCKAQQQKMARYCEDILGDLLLKEPLPYALLEPGVHLPSPQQLRHKILIKNVRLHPEVERQELELFRHGQLAIGNEEKEDPHATGLVEQDRQVPSEGTVIPTTPEDGESPIIIQHTGSTTNVHPLLSSIVNYAQPVKFQGFAIAKQRNIHYNMSSFAENTGHNYLKSQAIDFVNYNKQQMSRIYPKGTRVDSSNYLPQVFWNAGCQMVSLNFQTPDLPMQLNLGKFEYNGNCGYLLKPDFMRRADRSFDPFAESPVDGVIAAQCSVQVISGQFLSDRSVSTFVEVDMYGLSTDTIRGEFRTHTVPGNGLNPVYNGDPFLFRKVVLPDLAVLRFGVYDENNKLLGQRILPLDGLQAGYRHIPLKTEANFPMSLPMLFCNIELKIYVPDDFEDLMTALLDPGAYLCDQSMKQMEMKESDITTNDLKLEIPVVKNKVTHMPSRPLQIEDKKEDYKFSPITANLLRTNKKFLKLLGKQQKDLLSLKKTQIKERLGMQKEQCTAIEKLMKNKDPLNMIADIEIRSLVHQQTAYWTTLLERHQRQEWGLVRQQLGTQRDSLAQLMDNIQMLQIKELEQKNNREMQDLKKGQAKMSVESMHEVSNSKSLHTKGEKDRQLRERKQSNTKKFVEECRFLLIRQDKEKRRLKLQHSQQKEELMAEMHNLIHLYNNEEIEFEISFGMESYV